jgi:hypothetical protein
VVGERRLAPAVARSYGGAGVQGCLILSQVGLLFPVNHAPMKDGVPDPPSLGSYGGRGRL